MSEAICHCPRAEGCYACVRCRHTRCCVCDGHVLGDVAIKTMVRWCRDWRCQREEQLERGVWKPGQSGWCHAFECARHAACSTCVNVRTDDVHPPTRVDCPVCHAAMDRRGTWAATPSGHDPAAEVP